MQAVTHLGGMNGPQPALEEGGTGYALSPDESRLLVYHSSSVRPPEVYVVEAHPAGKARRITHTVTSAFTSTHWVQAADRADRFIADGCETTHLCTPVCTSRIHTDEILAGGGVHPRRRLSAGRTSGLVLLFPRDHVQHFPDPAWLSRAGHGLSWFRRLRSRLAHRHLPQHGPSGSARTSRTACTGWRTTGTWIPSTWVCGADPTAAS